jgi:hypothetical protein
MAEPEELARPGAHGPRGHDRTGKVGGEIVKSLLYLLRSLDLILWVRGSC